MKKHKKLKISLMIFLVVLISLILFFLIPELEGIKEYKESMTSIDSFDNGETITIMSANVRYMALKDKNGRNWIYRAPYLKMDIESVEPDIISFQEVERVHEKYLKTILSDYSYVIQYRNNSILSEACPIFYRNDRFELIDCGYFWLSDTPEKMSKDKDAGNYRICSYVILRDKSTSKELVVFSTHLDNESADSRIRGINLVLDKIEEFGFSDKAAILMGDMNDHVGSTTINALFNVFDDGYTMAKDKNGVEEYHSTYQGYGTKDEDRIDFFGVSKTGIIVNSYDLIDTVYSNDEYDAIYPSDHFPIVINVTLE